MKLIVLTGGPCAGKSTVLRAVETYLSHLVEIVPEAASHAFSGGFPQPQLDWTDQDWYALQMVVTYQQLRFEAEAVDRAESDGKRLIVCDRAPYDNLAYRAGPEAVGQLCGFDYEVGMRRYQQVIHLRSLAVTAPSRYSALGNECRYESLAEAQAQEAATLTAWAPHPNRVIVGGSNIEDVIRDVIALLGRVSAAD